MKKIRVSQKQIGRDLGLSQTLVSMVLNGRREGISEDSFEKIWRHARQVGYRPRGMDPEVQKATAGARAVGFILRSGLGLHTQSNFFSHVQHGLHSFLAEQGIPLVFLGSEEHLDARRLKEFYGVAHTLHGVVVMGEVKPTFIQALKRLETRIVTVSARYTGLCHSVLFNEEQAAEQLVEHLAELGHREFAWLGGSRGMQRARQRFQAVVSALRLRDLAIRPEFQIEVDGADRIEGRMAAQHLLKAAGRRHRPTAWIVFNGTMARGAANHLLQEGIQVPSDVSLACFDRTRVCLEEHPILTGAGIPPEAMGRVAGELLLKSTGAPDEMFSDMILPSQLATAESSSRRSLNPNAEHAKSPKSPTTQQQRNPKQRRAPISGKNQSL